MFTSPPNNPEDHVSIAYISSEDGKVVGLSKLNRIVEQFGRRGAIQEQLTVAIHNAVDKICEGNLGVAVMVYQLPTIAYHVEELSIKELQCKLLNYQDAS